MLVSLTVTSAVPVVTTDSAALVFQYAVGADVTSDIVGGAAPVPAAPVVPPRPVAPPAPVPMLPPSPLVPASPPAPAVPVGDSSVQLPSMQIWVGAQPIVQLPQWFPSDATHEPLQSISPAMHWHWPAWQIWAVAQGIPQPPQLAPSADVSTHAVPHSVWPGEQTLPAVPAVACDPPVPSVPPSVEPEQAATIIRRARTGPLMDARPNFIG